MVNINHIWYINVSLNKRDQEEYQYHPIEERILVKKSYNSSGTLVETIYYWSQNFITVVNASGSFNFTYVYHNGDLVAQQNPDGSKLFVLGDNKGSTSVILNSSGSVLERTTYSPTGEVLSGGRLNRYGYEGKEQEMGFGEIPTDGLVSYYALEGGAFDDGKGNQGSIVNATLTSGKVRDGYRFDGYGDYVKVNDSNSLDLTNSFTISAWIYPAETQQGYVVCKYGAYMIQFQGVNTSQGGIWINGTWTALVSTTSFLNEWTHVVFTYNGTRAIIYKNGAQTGSASTTSLADINTKDLYIGAKNSTDRTRDFNGSIDEVGVWNRALSSTEVADLYNYGSQFESGFRSTDFEARRYNPNMGIFEQPDTIIANPYNPQALNHYMFEFGNTYNHKDETGHNALLFLGAAALLIDATIYWISTPIDYDNPDWGGRLERGLAHGAVAAGVTVLTAPIGMSGGALRIVGPTLGSVAKGVVAGIGADLWINNIEGTKTNPQEITIAGATGGLSSLIPGSAGEGQYVATKSFFSLQNYKMLADVVTSTAASYGLVAAFNAGLNLLLNQKSKSGGSSSGKSSGSSGGSYYIGNVKVTPKAQSSYSNVRSYLGQ
ncbi:MAG: LamG domain-containing protein [archaeon]